MAAVMSSRRATAAVAAVAAALMLAPAATAAGAPSQVGPPPVLPEAQPGPAPQHQPSAAAVVPAAEALSNGTTTIWAHPVAEVPIYAEPSVHTKRLASTHIFTEDGFPEVYLLLDSEADGQGQQWVQLPIPGRPNGRVGWVQREALGGYHTTHWRIVISRRTRRLHAYDDGRLRFSAPVGIGKPSTPTPPGKFWIRERFRITSRSNPYWPWALGTSDYSVLTDWPGGGIVGIHGDFGEPSKIPGDPSHGCVRMRDSDIAKLAPLITLGTPVEIV